MRNAGKRSRRSYTEHWNENRPSVRHFLCRFALATPHFSVKLKRSSRNYVVTYGFVTFRLVDELGLFASLGRERYATTAWVCWTIPLLFAEVAMQWKRTVGAKS